MDFKTSFNPLSRTWSGKEAPRDFDTKISVGQHLLNALSKDPEHITQISANNELSVTNAEMKLQSIRVAENLRKMGFKKGDVISVMAKNHHHMAPIFYGSIIAGTPLSPWHKTADKDDLIHLLKITAPKLIIFEERYARLIRQSIKDLNYEVKLMSFTENLEGVEHTDMLLKETGTESSFVAPDLGDLSETTAILLLSSGTTGLFKKTCWSHVGLLSLPWSFMKSSTTLYFQTIKWAAGVLNYIFPTLNGGTRIITNSSFSPDLMIDLVEKYKVTHFSGIPQYINSLISTPRIKTADLSSIKFFTSIGFHLPDAIKTDMDSYLTNCSVTIFYGMTELNGMCAISYPGYKPDSVGQLVHNVQVRIIDENGDKLGEDDDGEIHVTSGIKYLGYYNNEECTKNMFDESGWIKTGDIGRFDVDGFLFIVGRRKELIRCSKAAIHPILIEEVIRKHSAVADVAVVGVPYPDLGQVPAAAIIRKRGTLVKRKEIMALVDKNLTEFKRLKGGVFFLDEFPKTGNGKLCRWRLQEIVEDLYNKQIINSRR